MLNILNLYIFPNLYKEILYKDIYDTMKHYDTSRKNGDEHWWEKYNKSEYHIVKSCKCNIDINNNSEKSNGETDVFQLSEDSIITRKRL